MWTEVAVPGAWGWAAGWPRLPARLAWEMRPPEEVQRLRPGRRSTKLLLAWGGEPRFLCARSCSSPSRVAPKSAGHSYRRGIGSVGHLRSRLAPLGVARRPEGRETWTRTKATLARGRAPSLTWRRGGEMGGGYQQASERTFCCRCGLGRVGLPGGCLQAWKARVGDPGDRTPGSEQLEPSARAAVAARPRPTPREPRGSLASRSGGGRRPAPATWP